MSRFAEVILPLAVYKFYTYAVPAHMAGQVIEGSRVEVQFGKKRIYAGLVNRLTSEEPAYAVKDIISVLDDAPLLSARQLILWSWIADYYMCTMGEVMLAGLPAGLKLASETIVVRNEEMLADPQLHSDEEFLILEALEFQSELTLDQIRKILDKKTVFPLINKMMQKQLISTKEEINKRYKPKTVQTVSLHPDYADDPAATLDIVSRYEKQVNCLLAYFTLSKQMAYVTKPTLMKKADVGRSSIQSLIKKGIFIDEERVVSRLGDLMPKDNIADLPELNSRQTDALTSIRQQFEEKNVLLLHGVTGSGKTRIYIELIRDCLASGKQILYLLPEIGLTTHFIERLRKIFGEAVTTFHSRLNQNQRTEVFKKARHEIKILVGPRSSIFLPFENLGLIIVDESHDHSYKQQDPAPRYHGRDTAIMIGRLHDAKVLLGTATPSAETYFNARSGKYGYVTLPERVKDLSPPEIKIYPINKLPGGEMIESISKYLLKEIRRNYEEGRQTLIFRNRRGYAPVLKCELCGWTAQCIHCDVSLTYHKASDGMRCHYCGYRANVSKSCPDCGNTKLILRGSGTEKITETLQLLLPEANIDRMDADTASGRAKMARILQEFEAGETDILVGTQMITKGLDFENVGLVGVILADALLYYPDFRAEERAHQVLAQVAGRAGRALEKSRVIIQTYQPEHGVFSSLDWDGQEKFYRRILKERKSFHYPPFSRFTKLSFYHSDFDIVMRYALLFTNTMRAHSSFTVMGPVPNPVKRVRSKYIVNCVIKTMRREQDRATLMQLISQVSERMKKESWGKNVRMTTNVDPY